MLLEGDGASGTLDSYYDLLQELYSVTGMIKKNGVLAEAYVYDTYGKVAQWGYRQFDPALDTAPPASRADREAMACRVRRDESRVHRDGDVDSGERGYVKTVYLGSSPFDPTADGGERSDRPRVAIGKAVADDRVRPAACPDGASRRRATGGWTATWTRRTTPRW